MAEMVQEKSTGLKFAEEQLLRYGWEKGKGLGRSENGISEAIKVKIKCGKGGMGHKEGEQFSFHWWDHVFNKASSSLVVETEQSGVMVKKSDDDSDGFISNKKPRKALQAKSMLYGFVKSATLLSGEKQSEKTSDSDSDDSSSSEDEDQKLDLSSSTKLSDTELLKACGGRTAHKGARHGLTMSAKLARLERQEQEFMNKYGKKNHTAETSTSSTDCLNAAGQPDIKKKTKCKKSKMEEGPSENNIHEDKITQALTSNDIDDGKLKKRKDSNDVSVNDDINTDVKPKKKKKKNRKEKVVPEDGLNEECSIDVKEAFTHTSEERETHLPMNDGIHKKKEKKRSKLVADTDEVSEDSTDACCKQAQEGSIDYPQTSENACMKKKKKNKSAMDLNETSPSTGAENSSCVMTRDTSTEAQVMDTQTEGQENNRKNKKKKRSKKEEQDVVVNVQFEESMPKKKKSKE